MVMVQAAFLQSFGNRIRISKSYCPPHLDSGCWPSSLGQGLAVGGEVPGCCVWLLGKQAGRLPV